MDVTQQFKNSILKFGKQISTRLSFSDGTDLENENVMSCSRAFEGDLFKSVMSYVDIELRGFKDISGKNVQVQFGVKADEQATYDYVDWGAFIVDNDTIEKSIDKNTTKFTAYDTLVKSCVPYVDLGITYPISISNYLLAICNHLGYTLKTPTFTNSSKLVTEEKFLNLGEYTFRDVLDQIAGVAGGIIICKNNDLYVKYPTAIDYTIDEHNLKSLNLLERWGPVNSLVLSLMPQEDNYYKQDAASIERDGLTEIKLANNEFWYKERESFIDDLFDRLKGLYFYPFELESFGYGFFEPLDVITINDLNGNSYQCTILSDAVNVSSGLNEKIGSPTPETTVTDYAKATSDKKALYKTILEVDKQNQVIKSLVSSTQEKLEEIELKPTIEIEYPFNSPQQIHSPSTGTYIPDWSEQPLILTPVIKVLGKQQVLDPDKITWTKKKGALGEHETVSDGILTINENVLEGQKTATYQVTYNYKEDKSVFAEVSFSLVSDGPKGTEGKDAAVCSIIASGMAFVSNIDENAYIPEQIVLTPKFQACGFDMWQYSIDGIVWSNVNSEQNGFTLDEDNVLTLSNDTPLLSDTQKCLNIKLISNQFNVVDVVSIVRVTDGNSVQSISNEYYISSSKEELLDGEWVSTAPSYQTGGYLWTRFKTVYKNPARVEYSEPVLDANWDALKDVNESLNAVQTIVTNNNTSFEERVDAINALVEQTQQTIIEQNNAITQIKNDMSTEVELTAQGILATITNIQTQIDSMGEQTELVKTYFKATEKGLAVQQDGNEVSTLMAYDHFAVLVEESEAVQIYKNLLKGENGHFTKSLRVGHLLETDYGDGVATTWVD